MSELRVVDPNEIVVGDRYRMDDGDAVALIQSVGDYGVINPITVDPELNLLAGRRRLKAALANKMSEIEVKVVETNDPRGVEVAENVHRKPHTNLELMHIAEDRITHHAGKQSETRRRTEPGIPQRVADDMGLTKTKVWQLLAISKGVKEAPDKFKDIVEMMQDPDSSFPKCYEQYKTIIRGYESAAKQKNKKTNPTEYHAPERTQKEPTARNSEPEEQDEDREREEEPEPEAEEVLTEDGRPVMLDRAGKRVPSHLRDVFAFNIQTAKYIDLITHISVSMKSAYGNMTDDFELESACGKLMEVITNHEAYAVCACKNGCDNCWGRERQGEPGYQTATTYHRIHKEIEEVSF